MLKLLLLLLLPMLAEVKTDQLSQQTKQDEEFVSEKEDIEMEGDVELETNEKLKEAEVISPENIEQKEDVIKTEEEFLNETTQAEVKQEKAEEKVEMNAPVIYEEKKVETIASDESWEKIIKDMIQNNGNVKAAYAEYRKQTALAGLKVVDLFMPDISVGWVKDFADPENIDYEQVITKETGRIVVKNSFGVQNLANIPASAFAVQAAKASVEQAIAKECQELLPNLLLLMQEQDLEKAHEVNVNRLERGLKSVRLRADKKIGLASESDVAQAQAAYEEGKSQLIAMKESLLQAKQDFKHRVGREPGTNLLALTNVDVDEEFPMQKTPAIREVFNKYKANRASSLGSKVSLITPSISTEFSTSNLSQNSPDYKPSAFNAKIGVGLDIYNAEKTQNALKSSYDAKSALEQYKFMLEGAQNQQTSYKSNAKSLQAQENALEQAVKAADRYALSEERKFEVAYREHLRDTSIINPEVMLRAFSQAHRTRLSWLEVRRSLVSNKLKYGLMCGTMWEKMKVIKK